MDQVGAWSFEKRWLDSRIWLNRINEKKVEKSENLNFFISIH